MEQKLEIYTNGTFKNIYLKDRYQRDKKGNVLTGADGMPTVTNKGLDIGNHVVVEKRFADGMKVEKPSYTSYNCGVIYEETDCAFFLYEKDHQKYAACGGQGDLIKISLKEERITDKKTGKPKLIEVLEFEKVD